MLKIYKRLVRQMNYRETRPAVRPNSVLHVIKVVIDDCISCITCEFTTEGIPNCRINKVIIMPVQRFQTMKVTVIMIIKGSAREIPLADSRD